MYFYSTSLLVKEIGGKRQSGVNLPHRTLPKCGMNDDIQIHRRKNLGLISCISIKVGTFCLPVVSTLGFIFKKKKKKKEAGTLSPSLYSILLILLIFSICLSL